MTRYKVAWVQRDSIVWAVADLEKQVEKNIDCGYTPIGTVSLLVTSYGTCTVAQAMVKGDDRLVGVQAEGGR